MDINKLSRGEVVVGVAGVALLVLSFMPLWSKYEFLGVTSRTGLWHAVFPFYVKLALLLVVAAVALVGTRAAGVDLSVSFSLGFVYLAAGGVATLFLVLGLVAGPAGAGLEGPGIEVSRGPLLFVGFLLSGVMTVGGYLHMQEEGGVAPTPGPAVPPPPPPA